MITVDGQPVDQQCSEADEPGHIRLQLKLCKALAALDPPHQLSVAVHSRIVDMLRTLTRYETTDEDGRQPADLTDEELREASGIIRALRAALPQTNYVRAAGLRAELGGYALDIVEEIERREHAPRA